MKAINHTNTVKKGITTFILTALFAGTISAQGMLVEGAERLIESLFNRNKAENTLFINANYISEAGDVTERSANLEIHPAVVTSFNVSNVSVSYETEISTEEWMSESFSNNMESGNAVESWMTEGFYSNIESEVAVEDWMTTGFYNAVEGEVTIEPWMTSPMVEESNNVEDWMLQRFEPTNTNTIELEDWMSEPFFSEESIIVEDWMTQPLI